MTDNAQVVVTPTVAKFLRRSLLWIGIVTAALLIAVFVAVLRAATTTSGEPMSATNAGPGGARALVEVLRDQGVEVTVSDSLDATLAAVTDPDNTTVFLYDLNYVLDENQLRRVHGAARDVVVLDPTPEVLALISPDIAPAGYVDGSASANCAVAAADAAGEITVNGNAYRVLNNAGEVDACFDSGDGVYSFVQVVSAGGRLTALGAVESLTNAEIVAEGNAALGLTLLGANDHLVWYLPGLGDYDARLATPAELSPDWLIPVSLTAFIVALAAMFWRGRRLGPLVVENLPVTVRASETMRGRARLYERANARLHTLDSLRIGTIARLATLGGLATTATVDEVVRASAATSGLDESEVRRLLIDAEPTTDRALVGVSDELLRLEQRVVENLRPH